MNNFSNNGQDNKSNRPYYNRNSVSNGVRRRPVQRISGNRSDNARTPPPQSTNNIQRNTPPRRNIPTAPAASKSSRTSRFVTVWIAVLAVFLLIILIISGIGRKDDSESDETVPVGAAIDSGTTTETVTEEIETYAVSYAEYSDDTTSFSSSLTFANGILIDLDTNTVVASKGGDVRIYPASMTKIMTLIVACENAKDLDDTFTMTAEITDPLYLANASVAGFSVGEEVTVRDLIYALILPSGGDGAMGLAYHIAGSEEAFAELMNEKAEELGLKNTHFTNCTGLHGTDHYSTCHEIALILEYAIKDDFMREVLSTYKYTTEKTPEHPEGIELTSTLFSRMYGDEPESVFVIGGKTGYTTEAKNCLATFATRFTEGESEDEIYSRSPNYILVTAGSDDKWGPVFDAISVYKSLGEDTEVDGTVTAGSESDEKNHENEADTENAIDQSYDSEESEESSADSGEVIIYTAAEPSKS